MRSTPVSLLKLQKKNRPSEVKWCIKVLIFRENSKTPSRLTPSPTNLSVFTLGSTLTKERVAGKGIINTSHRNYISTKSILTTTRYYNENVARSAILAHLLQMCRDFVGENSLWKIGQGQCDRSADWPAFQGLFFWHQEAGEHRLKRAVRRQ